MTRARPRGAIWSVALGLSGVGVGCATAVQIAPERGARVEGEGAPAPRATNDDAARADRAAHDTDRVVAAALTATSESRQLPALARVRGVRLSRKAMAAQVKRTIERDVPPEVAAAQGELLVALGVVPVNFDYVATVVSLMSTELAGYYEPEDKTMYLASDLGEAEGAATLSHELVHALQDQHYDLGTLLDYHPDASDAQTAAHAFAEGDATSAMLDGMLAPRGAQATDLSDELIGIQVRAGSQLSAGARDVPDILKRSLVAPYVDGIGLVHFLRRRGGWAEVDRVWRALPVSTEQLLHPEKLLSRELPLVVAAPLAPVGGPTEAVLTDVLGEQSVRLLLEEWIPRRSAEAGAAGWGGDRMRVFHSDDRYAVAVHLRADSTVAGARQGAALARGVVAQGGTAAGPRATCAERADRGPLRVEWRGPDVVVVAGPYRRAGASVQAAASCADAGAWVSRVLAQR